jgi:hypothetical protein
MGFEAPSGRTAKMPNRQFTVHDPERVKKMVDALERAWVSVEPRPQNEGAARSILASAIVNAVEHGAQSQDAWTQRAMLTLWKERKMNPELFASSSSQNA